MSDATPGSTDDGVSGDESANPTDAPGETPDGDDTPESAVGNQNVRHERITATPTPGPKNSLQYWTNARSPLRIIVNFLAVQLIKYSPILRVKTWLLRRLGADIGSGVSLALSATPDVFWPELIRIEDDAIVGYDVTILCHEFLRDEYRTGGVHVGEGARVAANSLIAEDVPAGATVAGVPAERVD